MTPEDIFQRLTIKDDPDAADIYRRLLQRGGGDGERECAETEASPWPALVPVTFEQMMLDLGAFLNSDDFSGDLADVTYDHGVTACLVMRGRCWTHPLDDPGFDEWLKRFGMPHAFHILAKAQTLKRGWHRCRPYLGYWCEAKDVGRQNLVLPPPLVFRRAPRDHAYTPQHQQSGRTSGPPRRRPTLSTAPRR